MANQHQFKIGTVAKLTGLTSHNIRAWEKRHKAVVAHRLESGRRFYTQNQIDRLLNLKKCVELGSSISSVAQLSDEELHERVIELNQQFTVGRGQCANVTVNVVGTTDFSDSIAAINQVQINHCEHTADLANIQYCKALTEHPAHLLILQCPNLNDPQVNSIRELVKNAGHVETIVVYRYTNQRGLAELRELGVRTLRAPLDENSLPLAIDHFRAQFFLTAKTPPSDTVRQYPAHLFTLSQLAKISDLPNTVECECPHHLVELIEGLKAFERYSGECINKNDDDAALHAKIQRTTAGARHQLELLLQEVLEAEGLSLEETVHDTTSP